MSPTQTTWTGAVTIHPCRPQTFAMARRCSSDLTTMKCHGWVLLPEGAKRAASMSDSTAASVTGSAVYLRMLRRSAIGLSTTTSEDGFLMLRTFGR
jgi:hypothetical protein